MALQLFPPASPHRPQLHPTRIRAIPQPLPAAGRCVDLGGLGGQLGGEDLLGGLQLRLDAQRGLRLRGRRTTESGAAERTVRAGCGGCNVGGGLGVGDSMEVL